MANVEKTETTQCNWACWERKSAKLRWKGPGGRYPLMLKSLYNLCPNKPIHTYTPNKNVYVGVYQNICERFPAALFIHKGPNQKSPRCPSVVKQTNERRNHRKLGS